MKYLKEFATQTDCDNFMNGENYEEPFTALITENGKIAYNKEPQHDYSKDYFTVKALTNTTFTFGRRAAELPKYRINGEEWIEAGDGGIQGLTLNANDEIELSWAPDVSSNPNTYSSIFTISGGQYEFFGNIFSLMYGDNFIGETSFVNTAITFTSMFNGCTGLTSAENLILPATTLNTSSYNMMFYNCTNLTTAPELPATTLAANCYKQMFKFCSSLVTPPSKIGTSDIVLANNCCEEMFQDCTSLTTAPELPSITLATDCYKKMFSNCISLDMAPVLPATTMAQTCYSDMFYNCQSLTSAPELPATTLYNGCYMSMFNYCVNLNYVKCLATSGMGTHTSNWLQGVANTGTFVKDANATWQTGTTSGVPNGWTVQDAE